VSDDQPKQRQPSGDRTPIPCERLVFSMSNPHGAMLPWGPTGENVQPTSILKAGVQGTFKIEIDWEPWRRRYRVTRSARKEDAKGKETYEVIGRPFHVPEVWATHVELEQ
jgi:hypothetical protein